LTFDWALYSYQHFNSQQFEIGLSSGHPLIHSGQSHCISGLGKIVTIFRPMTIVAGNREVSEALTAEQLMERLQDILQAPSSGLVTLRNANGSPIGSLKFSLGRLIWANGGSHRWRRWRRLTQQFCPQLEGKALEGLEGIAPADDWEYQALAQWVQQQKIPRERAIALLEQHIVESLFDLIQLAQGGCRFSSGILTEVNPAPLGAANGLALFNQAQQAWQAWQAAGLAHCFPDAAPVVCNATALQQRTSPQTYQTLSNLLNGQSTLRELAVVMRQDLKMLAQTLLAYTQWELIGLETLADLDGPWHSNSTGNGNAAPTPVGVPQAEVDAPLIMCIDDNPKICEMLGKILTSAGYRFVSVQDSLQALPVLLERKPDFIFLDLVMPVASGYEVCSQIRRISSFKEVPVVILTGNDGIIDRIRSKASGSTDFISKPLDVSKVLSAIKQYLPDRVPSLA
jgi:two-component system, chemotaxis family, response regulator PixG